MLALLSISTPCYFWFALVWFGLVSPSGLHSRCQTLDWLALLHPLGGKGEALVIYNPFRFPGLELHSDDFHSESSLAPPPSEVTGGCIFSSGSPGRAHAELIRVCRTFALKSFLAKLDAPLGGLLQ